MHDVDLSSRSVLLSKRAHVFYLEHARVMVKNGRVIYLTAYKDEIDRAFNIPDANTTFLLLGKGTSITDGAARMLAESNVVIGFCGSGGSPLVSGIDIAFLTPQSEYRPTEWMQRWARMWFDDRARLQAAKHFLRLRIKLSMQAWEENDDLSRQSIRIHDRDANAFDQRIRRASNTTELLSAEAEWAKGLYATLARGFKIADFTRDEAKRSRESVPKMINSFLDHGNYLAYGYAGVALYALGISYAFPLLHGKTRRGALVFDLADLIKDAYVMPMAFALGAKKESDRVFRSTLVKNLREHDVITTMINGIEETLDANAP